MKIVCAKLKELRLENNLTQQDVAKILKVSRPAYNRYENCERELPFVMLRKLADFYDVSLDYLAERDKFYK